jgi:hypothetical protein
MATNRFPGYLACVLPVLFNPYGFMTALVVLTSNLQNSQGEWRQRASMSDNDEHRVHSGRLP